MRAAPYLLLLLVLAGLWVLSPFCAPEPVASTTDSAAAPQADDPAPAPAGAELAPAGEGDRREALTPAPEQPAADESPATPGQDGRFEVRGLLLYPDTRPAAQASLVLYDAASSKEVFGGWDTKQQLRAGDDGAFQFRVAAGSYFLAVWHTEGEYLSEQSFAVDADLDLGTLLMRPGAIVELTVVSAADGSPVEEPWWRLDSSFEQTRASPPLPRWKLTAIFGQDYFSSSRHGQPDGNRITIRCVPAGPHRIEVRALGYARREVEIEFRDDEVVRQLVELHPEGRLHLTVLHADGAPVQGESIHLWPEEQIGQSRISGTGYGFLDDDGVVELRRIPPGIHRVVVGEDRGLDEFLAKIEVVSGDNRIELVLPELGELRCQVVDGDGPVAGARIYVTALDQSQGGGLAQGMGDNRADESGLRVLAELPAGRYRIGASRPGSFPAYAVVEYQQSDQTVVLRIGGATLSGRIEGADEPVRFALWGKPVDPWLSDAQADALLQDPERRLLGISGSGITEADGSFVLRDVPPGRYTLAVQERDFAFAQTDPFRVLDQDTEAPPLRLVKSGALLVRVKGTEGSWSREGGVYRGTRLQLSQESPGRAPFQALDHDGDYRFSLGPGQWRAQLFRGSFRERELTGWERELTILSEQETVLELDLRLLKE